MDLIIYRETPHKVLMSYCQQSPIWISKSAVLHSEVYRLFNEREACTALLLLHCGFYETIQTECREQMP